MDRQYSPHRPVGERCVHARIHHDGRSDNFWDDSIEEFTAEWDALRQNTLDPKLTWSEHRDYFAQLEILREKALVGNIAMGHRGEGNVLRDTILELKPRLSSRPVFGRKARLLRLYFAEPANIQRCLLSLHLAAKEDDRSGLDEQDDAIGIALGRVREWSKQDQ